VYGKFEKGGFLTVFVPAIMPPPFPTGPFLVAAGALDYPLKKFMAQLAAARTIRYMGLAYLAFRYGNWITRTMSHYYRPLLWTFTILLILAGMGAGGYLWMQHKRGKLNLDNVRKPRFTRKRVA